MLNKVMLIGNVGRDPEQKTLSGNLSVATFSLAATERYKDKNGEPKESTTWVAVTAWGALAGIVASHVKKGMRLYVEGKLTINEVEKDGRKASYTSITATTIRFLDKPSSESKPPATGSPNEEFNDDLPF